MGDLAEKWVPQLQTALQQLKDSEIDRAIAAAQYAELEAVFRRKQKPQPAEPAAPAKVESSPACKLKDKTRRNANRMHDKASKSGERLQRKLSVATDSAAECTSWKSGGDQAAAKEASQCSQVQKRLQDFKESMERIHAIADKASHKKETLLFHLNKLNSESWKIQQSRNPVIAKLQTYMHSSG